MDKPIKMTVLHANINYNFSKVCKETKIKF